MNGLSLSVHSYTKAFIVCVIAFALNAFAPNVYAEQYTKSQNLDWHYTIRPDDSLPKVADRLLKPQYSWSSIAHYNHIEDIDKLLVGSIIKVPISWLKYQPQPAKVTKYKGGTR